MSQDAAGGGPTTGAPARSSQEMEGWLCPALFHYFEATPMKIFARIDPLPAGVDPIWEVEEGTVVRGSDVEEHGLPT